MSNGHVAPSSEMTVVPSTISATAPTDRQTTTNLYFQRPAHTLGQKHYGATSTPRRSPEGLKRSESAGLISVPEDADESMDFTRTPTPLYTGGADLNAGDEDEDEVEEWLIDEDLARQGLYRGSYKRILAFYSLTPLSTLLTFAFLACFPILVYPLPPDSPHSPYPYAPYAPYPLPELLTAGALWALCQLIRESLASSFFAESPNNRRACRAFAGSSLQTLVSVVLQLSAIVLLLLTPSQAYDHPSWRDHGFRRVWAIALGWAGVEAIVGIKQGYENLGLYRDVLVTVRRISSPDSAREGAFSLMQVEDGANDLSDLTTMPNERQPLLPSPALPKLKMRVSRNAIADEVEDDLEQLMALKSREELEEVYGMPLIYVPVFIPPLHRINAVLLSLGSFLLLSGAYLRSTFGPKPHPLRHPDPSPSQGKLQWHLASHSNTIFTVTLLSVFLCQLLLTVLHTSWILPRIGVHTFVYVSLLISLGMFFAGLGFWEALV